MESKELKNIIPIQSIWEDLDLLEDRLIEISSSSDPYLTEISQYLISAGGKRFRPLIALLAGKLGEGDNKKVIDFLNTFKIILNNPNIKGEFRTNLTDALINQDYGMLDAEDMDYILQTCIFGSCVYG